MYGKIFNIRHATEVLLSREKTLVIIVINLMWFGWEMNPGQRQKGQEERNKHRTKAQRVNQIAQNHTDDTQQS